jgi:peptide/nickel transport system ATP-binding protein/oligopeptide transport system ATP-binding protein
LDVAGLTVTFPSESGRVPVVDGVSFQLARGEVLALVGESGCGKSMSALSLMRLLPKPGRIESGKLVLEGRDLMSLSVPEMRKVRGRDISMIFQEPMTSLNPVMTAGDQVVETLRLHERIGKKEAYRRAAGLFEQVGIPDPQARLHVYPHQLSGGMKQRVMIAMALATRPKLLIADEPTTALDVTIQAQIIQLLRDLQKNQGTSILLITHNLGVVNELADRVVVMYAGQISEEGTRAEVLSQPKHPYTLGLLGSVPKLSGEGGRLQEIPGTVPPPSEWPKGCRFTSRCFRAFEPCPHIPPPRVSLSQTQTAYCHAVKEDVSR